MPQSICNLQWGKAHFNQHTGVGMPQIVDSYDGQPYFGSYSFYFHLSNVEGQLEQLRKIEKILEKHQILGWCWYRNIEGIMALARRLWEAVCKRIWHLFGYGEANWHDVAGGGGNVRIEEKKPYG